MLDVMEVVLVLAVLMIAPLLLERLERKIGGKR